MTGFGGTDVAGVATGPSRVLPALRDGDRHVAAFASLLNVVVGLDELVETVAPVDDGDELALLDELLDAPQ